MKENDNARVRARMLKEPGLPPFFQAGGDRSNWETALFMPTLSRLRFGLPSLPPPEFRFGELEPSDVPVHILTKDRWPSEIQFSNCLWFPEMDGEYCSCLLQAIYDSYASIRSNHDFLSEEDAARCLPDLADPSALHPIIRLNWLTIHAVAHASTPYIGAEFACAWDDEQGLGMLSCGTEIIDLGTADVAVNGDRARAHRAELLEKLKHP